MTNECIYPWPLVSRKNNGDYLLTFKHHSNERFNTVQGWTVNTRFIYCTPLKIPHYYLRLIQKAFPFISFIYKNKMFWYCSSLGLLCRCVTVLQMPSWRNKLLTQHRIKPYCRTNVSLSGCVVHNWAMPGIHYTPVVTVTVETDDYWQLQLYLSPGSHSSDKR